MPSLQDIASHFDDVVTTDAYSGAALFKAQYGTFIETSPDGSGAINRVMSVRPGTVMPTRRVLAIFDERWIVGNGNTDALAGETIRVAYLMRKVTDSAVRLTPAEACVSAVGYSVYVSKDQLKETVNGVTDSEYDNQAKISLASTEAVTKGQFFRIGGDLFRIRSRNQEANGFLSALADELDTGYLVSAAFGSTGVYDPVTDSYPGGTTITPSILIDTSKLYRFRSEADAKFLSGDMTLITTNTAPVGATVTIAGVLWKIITKTVELDAFNLHIRLR